MGASLAPFILGALLALLLYPRVSSSGFVYQFRPVHGRVDVDYGLSGACAHPNRLPDEPEQACVLALSCAAIDDVTAWCLLASVVGIDKAEVDQGLFVVAGALAFIAFMFLLGVLYCNGSPSGGTEARSLTQPRFWSSWRSSCHLSPLR